MNNTSAVFAALFLAFVIYVTAKGELRTYIQIMLGKCQKTNASAPTTAPALPALPALPKLPSLGGFGGFNSAQDQVAADFRAG